MVASILLQRRFDAGIRIESGQNVMSGKKSRLEEIQDQLDVLMEEVNKLRENILDQEGRRRTYPFPFERATAHDVATPRPRDPDTRH